MASIITAESSDMTSDSFNRSLDFNKKFKYFAASWLLVEVVLIDAFGKFLLVLNHLKAIHLDKHFDPNQIIWGEQPFWNIVKVAVICSFSFMFGIVYSYLARKVRESEKAAISLINTVVGVFGTLIILLVVSWLFTDTSVHDSLVAISQIFKENKTYSFFVLVQIVGAAVFTYLGLNKGQELVKNLPEDDKGKFLGIKWFHYLWMWFAISVYVEALLFLIYLTVHSLSAFLSQFRWWDVFGGTTGSNSTNSIEKLGSAFIFYYLIAAIIFGMVKYERDILSGEVKLNLYAKIGVSILVALVVPLLLIMFTNLGYNSVQQ